ncbi:hypothetical protein [Kitasatospora sp. NPDC056181]|uniref:hypothetical protein n=1 Tax=Kitasatospora sp. NPDC056181 TaxID=3345737 RepID=UPI0035D6C410
MTDSTSSPTPPQPDHGQDHGQDRDQGLDQGFDQGLGQDQQQGTGPQSGKPDGTVGGRVKRLRRWTGRRERRIAAGVAAVALLGAGGLALAAAHEEHGRGHHVTGLADGHGHGGHDREHRGGRHRDGEWADGQRGDGRPGEDRQQDGRRPKGQPQQDRHQQAGDRPGGVAPAPLPSLAASTALEKAQGAVPGGRVECLKQVAQRGGGSAWAVVVVGPDGVRHLVTVDEGGQLTGNTVVNGTVDGAGR